MHKIKGRMIARRLYAIPHTPPPYTDIKLLSYILYSSLWIVRWKLDFWYLFIFFESTSDNLRDYHPAASHQESHRIFIYAGRLFIYSMFFFSALYRSGQGILEYSIYLFPTHIMMGLERDSAAIFSGHIFHIGNWYIIQYTTKMTHCRIINVKV